jgi:hypothetical protein
MQNGDFTPGFRFKEGKLCIFREQEVVVVNTWPNLTAVAKTAASPKWRSYWPRFRLIYPYRRSSPPSRKQQDSEEQLALALDFRVCTDRAEERKRAFDAFRFSFPKAIANAVERFPSEQWSLLHLLRDDPQAIKLVAANPAVAYLLADYFIGRYRGHHECPLFSHIKQKVLVHRFGFPPTDAVVNILKKVPAESVSLRRLARLRFAVGDPEIQKTLSHLEVVNAGVVELVGDPDLWQRCTPRLLREVSECLPEKYRADTAELLRQILVMEQAVNPGQTGTFQSRDQMQRRHDELTVEFCRRGPEAVKMFTFPRPPLPGVPIASCRCERQWNLSRKARPKPTVSPVMSRAFKPARFSSIG